MRLAQHTVERSSDAVDDGGKFMSKLMMVLPSCMEMILTTMDEGMRREEVSHMALSMRSESRCFEGYWATVY